MGGGGKAGREKAGGGKAGGGKVGGEKPGGGKGRRVQEGRWKEKRRRKVLVVTNHLCYQLLCSCYAPVLKFPECCWLGHCCWC